MKAMVVLWFMSLNLISSVANAEVTAGELLETYDRGSATDKQFIRGILSNTVNGMSWANTHLETVRREQAVYCPPRTLALVDDQILDIMRHEVEMNPHRGFSPYGLAMQLALINTFPCPPVAR